MTIKNKELASQTALLNQRIQKLEETIDKLQAEVKEGQIGKDIKN